MENYFTRYNSYLETISKIQDYLSDKGYLRTHIPLIDKHSNYSFLENDAIEEQYVLLMESENKVVRFDSTISLSQLLAKHKTSLPFKAHYATTVLHKARQLTEIWQIGTEHFFDEGENEHAIISDMLQTLCEAIELLQIKDFTIHIGYVPLVDSLFGKLENNAMNKMYQLVRNRKFKQFYDTIISNNKETKLTSKMLDHLFKITDASDIVKWDDELSTLGLDDYWTKHYEHGEYKQVREYIDTIRQLFNKDFGTRLRLDLSEVPETSFHYGIIFSAYATLDSLSQRPVCIAKGGNYTFPRESSQENLHKFSNGSMVSGLGFTLYPSALLELSHDF